MNDVYQLLDERGFFYQITDEKALRRRLGEGPTTFYLGFDPTGDSLHVGHLLPIMAARHLQKAGHRPVILVGGGTAMIGDPTGRTEMRQLLSRDDVRANSAAIRTQLELFLDLSSDTRGLIVDNFEWLGALNYIEFLRDFGKHFSVNKMLSAESVKQRLEKGLSFLEFNYMLLQAYDYYVLARDTGCELQIGGQDQWGNIVAGIDLVRRQLEKTVYGATFPLLTDSSGQKFGKSTGDAVWLDPARTSTFDYYQFWRNTDDADMARTLALFTELPMDDVNALGALEAPAVNRAKEVLAYEATRLVHGDDTARTCYLAAGSRFGFSADSVAHDVVTSSDIEKIVAEDKTQDLPSFSVSPGVVKDGVWVVKLLVDSGLCKSNGDARRTIKGGGAYIDDERITDETAEISTANFSDGAFILRVGKKQIRRIVIQE